MLADLLSERYDADLEETWENERTATPVRAFAVRLHETGCSLREWFEQFVHYYNYQRPHQSLDGRTPVEEVLN